TVIVPTYNRSGYVRDCLTGLRQSGVPDLEVIVADDGSTDDTREVVGATDPRAKYLWQPNTGTPATARNAAFAVSTGRYVAFLDCDDAWLPGAPAEAVRLLDAPRRLTCCSPTRTWATRKTGTCRGSASRGRT